MLSNKSKELASIAAHKGAYIWSGVIFLVAALVTIASMVGVIRLFRGRRVTLGQVAGGLLLLGNTAIVGFYTFTTVEYEMVNQPGLDRAQMAKLVDKADNATSQVPLVALFFIGIVLGLILLAVATWRSKRVPTWAAPVLVATAVSGAAGSSKTLGIVTFVLLLVGLAGIAMKVLGMSDEEWDAPRDAAAPVAPAEPPAAPAVA